MINCFAVDDDLNALENLSQYLQKLKGVTLVKRYSDPLLALSDLNEMESIDLIFMDVEMPNISGMELAKILRKKTKNLIFTTAHPRYALDAFEVYADAFLLRPFTYFKLEETLNRIYHYDDGYRQEFSILEKNAIYIENSEADGKLTRIEVDNIIAARPEKEHYVVYTSNIAIKLPLSASALFIKQILPHSGFMQVDHSSIVAESHIWKVEHNIIQTHSVSDIKIGPQYSNQFHHYTKSNLLKNRLK